MLFAGFYQNSWQIRQALISCDNFDCAHRILAFEPMPSMGYNTLAGVKDDEGVVISRDRFGPAHQDWLNSTAGKWFVVQANVDEWKDGCTDRCGAATEMLNNITQAKIDINRLRNDVLLVYPVLNHDTLYNTDFQPKQRLTSTIPEDFVPSAETIANSKFKYDAPKKLNQ